MNASGQGFGGPRLRQHCFSHWFGIDRRSPKKHRSEIYCGGPQNPDNKPPQVNKAPELSSRQPLPVRSNPCFVGGPLGGPDHWSTQRRQTGNDGDDGASFEPPVGSRGGNPEKAWPELRCKLSRTDDGRTRRRVLSRRDSDSLELRGVMRTIAAARAGPVH